MAVNSSIEWTESTWNPVTGCSKISPGCRHCYAERMAIRLHAMGQPNYSRGFKVTCHEQALNLPLQWRSPQLVFVNSMSDLFHDDVPADFIKKVFAVMNSVARHKYQVLTKRSARLLDLAPSLPWPDHIWAGVSVESREYLCRIDDLRQVPARVRFLSLEPLLGPLPDMNLKGIHWVVVGGESGPGARPMDPSWVKDIRDQCLRAEIPFFFKQWGGVKKKAAGRALDGQTWDQMPALATTVSPVPGIVSPLRGGDHREGHIRKPSSTGQ